MKKSKESVIELRSVGKTYKEICDATGYSCGAVSYICNKHIPNNDDIYKSNRLNTISSSQQKRMRLGADLYYETLRLNSKNKWLSRLLDVPQNSVFYMSGLYDGDGNHSGTEFSIANSDRNIILFALSFLDMIGANVKLRLVLHNTHNRQECISYWNPIKFDSITQTDCRKQKSAHITRYNFGTVNIRVLKPLGLRNAMMEFSMSHNPNRY